MAERLPTVTAELPGTGGAIRTEPEDFQVEEIPAYLPSGAGEHVYLWVEKRGRTTQEVARELARALGARERDVGTAGLKDKRALTRQLFSLHGVDEHRAAELSGPGFRVLSATRHGNKLRTGHLRGNRFCIRIRGCVPEAPERAQAIAAALSARGFANFFGEQRFGRDGDNAALGKALLLGQEHPQRARVERDRFLRRLALSALQSQLFNRCLATRVEANELDRALAGDVMKKLDSGGLFLCEDPAADTERTRAFEVSPAGPMFGPKMLPAQGAIFEREARLLQEAGLTLEDFARGGGEAEGTRRPFRLPLKVEVAFQDADLLLDFVLPRGAYASCVLREFTKSEPPDLGPAGES